MASTDELSRPHFDISAAVVFRLGDELITDEVQALVELVKNSRDADATWVKITVDTRAANQWGRKYPEAVGVVVIEDDGVGMNQDSLEKGWLKVASSQKKVDKAEQRTTGRGRTPIGDKGLGRLGAQKLARNVEVFTRPANDDIEYYLAFSWDDFVESRSLSQVPLVFEPVVRTKKMPGTCLVLSGLRDVEKWRDESYLGELTRKLSGMLSPFEEVREVATYLEIDGKMAPLAEVAQKVREAATLKYVIDFDGTMLTIRGRARLDYLLPNDRGDRYILRRVLQDDQGEGLITFLAGEYGKKRPRCSFSRSDAKGWFVEFSAERCLEDLDGHKMIDGELASPGPFKGEVDHVPLRSTDELAHAVDRSSAFRQLVRDLAGVRVFRDGFGIRLGGDWLGLSKQWTGGTSYYGLRPENVLGYVALSAKANGCLIETTSREGFQVTPHLENFLAVMAEFVKFAGEAQGFLRRGVLEYLKQHKEGLAGVLPGTGATDLTRQVQEIVGVLAADKTKLERRATGLKHVTKRASDTLARVRREVEPIPDAGPLVAAAMERIDQALGEVSAVTAETDQLLKEVAETLRKYSDLRGIGEVLNERWTTLQEELLSVYEGVSLGLTAEALSHEIHNIADVLARRSSVLLRQVKLGTLRQETLVAYVEHVRSSAAAMRKQLAHLVPSLKYLREQKESIDVRVLLAELAQYHNARLALKGIRLDVVCGKDRGFAVLMNKGKLCQVLDNLILNSEYWLKEAMRTGHVKEGLVSLDVDAPYIRVRDNGRGVDPVVEDTLFEPFVTRKARGQGRGLGLFVVQQLLDSESCSATLLPDRNHFGRRHVFELDMTGALNG